MVRLLLRTPERSEQWQRAVDDFRGDEVDFHPFFDDILYHTPYKPPC
jgi:hypothetical protein